MPVALPYDVRLRLLRVTDTQFRIKPLPGAYNPAPTGVGTHTAYLAPISSGASPGGKRLLPVCFSVSVALPQKIGLRKRASNDLKVGGRGVSNGYLSAEIQDRAQMRNCGPPILSHQPYAGKLLR